MNWKTDCTALCGTWLRLASSALRRVIGNEALRFGFFIIEASILLRILF